MVLCLACKKKEVENGDMQCKACQVRVEGAPANYVMQKTAAIGKSDVYVLPPAQPMADSLKLTCPWSSLASDNLRKGMAGAENRSKQKRYGAALEKFRTKVKEQYDASPITPAAVDAWFYVPDLHARDGANFSKLIGDGLKGIVIVDDKFQNLSHFCVDYGGVDCDAPRCEIFVKRVDMDQHFMRRLQYDERW